MEQQRFVVQEIDSTSPLRKKCQEFCKEELSDGTVIIAEIDGFSESVVGVCSLTQAGRLLRLKFFVEEVEKTRERTLRLYSLCEKALKIAQDRFAELIVVTGTYTGERPAIEELGFVRTETDGEDYVFPPPYSLLKKYCEKTSMCEADDRDAVSAFLRKIVGFEFVPLVYLRGLMSVEKVGESILRTFVSAAMKVQKLQMTQIRFEDAKEMVNEEALLLDYAWERLNTGHFSEVDECWRIVFAATSLLKAVRLALAGQYLNAIAAVDLGLIMGDCIPDQLLQRYAQFLDTCLPKPPKIASDEINITLSVPRRLPNSVAIKSFDDLSKWDFVDQFLAKGEPVIVRQLNSHWPACKNWNFDYLHRVLCRRVVPVEQGSKYTDTDWAQKLMTGSEFFNTVSKSKEGSLYLAQHRLFEQVPQLRDDFSLPLYCDHCEDRSVDKNCWIGPGGTISPLHTDPRENLFCQIMGRKFLRLVSPDDSENVYAYEDGIITNTSQVDALNPDLDKYPQFAQVRCWDGVVEGGDVLFIPKGWWHLVASLSSSISISFWFDK